MGGIIYYIDLCLYIFGTDFIWCFGSVTYKLCNIILSMVNVFITMPDVALLVTEYWYTPGSLPVTVSVLRY